MNGPGGPALQSRKTKTEIPELAEPQPNSRSVWSAPSSGAFYFVPLVKKLKAKDQSKSPEDGALQTLRETQGSQDCLPGPRLIVQDHSQGAEMRVPLSRTLE